LLTKHLIFTYARYKEEERKAPEEKWHTFSSTISNSLTLLIFLDFQPSISECKNRYVSQNFVHVQSMTSETTSIYVQPVVKKHFNAR